MFRRLFRDPFYAVLNIVGLSIGIATSILILLYISDELSFDRHHQNHERIFRVTSSYTIADDNNSNTSIDKNVALSGILLGPLLLMENPEIQTFVRLIDAGENLFKHGNDEHYESMVYYVDSTIFDVFQHKFIYGSAQTALKKANQIILTQKVAEKFFGTENPIGKTLLRSGNQEFTVVGVIENVKKSSHLRFDVLISMSTINGWLSGNNSLWRFNAFTYILLKDRHDISKVVARFPSFYDKYMSDAGKRLKSTYVAGFQPLQTIHLNSKLEWDLPIGNWVYIWVLSAVALFILVVAAINYMNMATARSALRTREVGIRKVIGASRFSLIRLFIGESVLLSLIAMIFGLGIVELSLDFFNQITDKQICFSKLLEPLIASKVLVITILVGFLAGSYPAFYLSNILPVWVLKGVTRPGKRKGLLRRVLVVFQFVVSIVMIIGTIAVSQQLEYFFSKDIGFNKKNILVSPIRDTSLIKQIPIFRREILKNAEIKAVATSSSRLPDERMSRSANLIEVDSQMIQRDVNYITVDYSYIEMMGIGILAGRAFVKDSVDGRKNHFIINESAVKSFGWKNNKNAIGKCIQLGVNSKESAGRNGYVIGVARDFNYISLHSKIDPIIIVPTSAALPLLNIRISDKNISKTMRFIEHKRKSFGGNMPFNFRFLHESITGFYSTERKMQKIFSYFSILTIIVSCLGVLGLISYVAERRTKEIGIRKTLGASVRGIVLLLSKDFFILVFISNLIAWPIAYFIMYQWFEMFAFHTKLGVDVYLISGGISVIITIIAVGYQSIRAAYANPSDALTTE